MIKHLNEKIDILPFFFFERKISWVWENLHCHALHCENATPAIRQHLFSNDPPPSVLLKSMSQCIDNNTCIKLQAGLILKGSCKSYITNSSCTAPSTIKITCRSPSLTALVMYQDSGSAQIKKMYQDVSLANRVMYLPTTWWRKMAYVHLADTHSHGPARPDPARRGVRSNGYDSSVPVNVRVKMWNCEDVKCTTGP